MAKRGYRSSSSLESTAETIGASLGQLAKRLDAWKQQRSELASEVNRVLASARGMLGELIESKAGEYVAPPAAPRNKGGRPKGYKMAASTRAKLRAAWRRRKRAMKNPGQPRTAKAKGVSSGKADGRGDAVGNS